MSDTAFVLLLALVIFSASLLGTLIGAILAGHLFGREW